MGGGAIARENYLFIHPDEGGNVTAIVIIHVENAKPDADLVDPIAAQKAGRIRQPLPRNWTRR